MPDQDLTSLHADLLSGEPTAPRRLVNTCGERLYAILKRRHSQAPQETVQDAVHDALIALIQHPERFDVRRGRLSGSANLTLKTEFSQSAPQLAGLLDTSVKMVPSWRKLQASWAASNA